MNEVNQQIDFIGRIRAGEIRAVARAISWIENDHARKEELIDALYPCCGRAIVWGITGPPGSGKSTLVDQLITRERQKNKKVAVIAVDPSSPFSGGAILGDRLRMQKHATDPGVFIRSMASRGHLGGVAGATADAIKVLDAAGFDLIIIETIGVGQTEIEIVEMADMVLLVLVPGLGDEIQALKAGIMEIGDIFIINKADKDEAAKVKAEVEYVLSLKFSGHQQDKNPVFMTSATQNSGVDQLTAGIEDFFMRFSANGMLENKRKKRIAGELRSIMAGKISNEINRFLNMDEQINGWVDAVYKKQHSPYTIINQKLPQFLKELKTK